MPIRIYNTLTGKKEDFVPLQPGRVGIYVCGVTVYDLCHIGHARSAVVFDVIVGYFRWRGFKVNFVRNFTDVDDKIINRANESGISVAELADKFIAAFYDDMDALGVKRADVEPRVTEHIEDIVATVAELVAKNHAYAVGGDVYYDVTSFPEYGKLSHRNLDDMRAGARVETSEQKRHPLDFALWKSSKPGEPAWPSPWGFGRPGWHIECSVMSARHLGPNFDIHGGGKDLVFPHHENEIAQSEAANGTTFANYWMHNGFVRVNLEKMSKSLGNFRTIRDILKNYHPETLRLFLLSSHYRSPVDYSDDTLTATAGSLTRLYNTLGEAERLCGGPFPESEATSASAPLVTNFWENFIQAMDDDFNTAGAIGRMFGLAKDINRLLADQEADKAVISQAATALLTAGRILGLLTLPPAEFLKSPTIAQPASEASSLSDAEIETLLADRATARKEKRFADADGIRRQLTEAGIIIEDRPNGATWRRK
ncbi:MAG: cysteine--tRNA ligase [Deltaproteobacteria bacterium]|nr:cysteine--tRNA ligase [Deltaproteobacteria bacterium]